MPGVGSLYYGSSEHPYQVSLVTPATTNTIPPANQSVSYTSYHRPLSISQGGQTASFLYNENDDRSRMTIVQNNTTVLTRHYLGECYEVDEKVAQTDQRLYLGGNYYDAPMVYVKEGSGNWTLYNIGRDYLGSVTHVATAAGVLVAEYSYDPWGRQRDPATLDIYEPGDEPDLFLGRGFTGHEHLDWCGLINMNARLYDPLYGRFLSPDPFVQTPDFSQNFNRYSYALNNPLKYTDEDGEWIHLVVGALLGGLSNWWMNGHEWSWTGLGYFGVGAVAGALSAGIGAGVSAALAGETFAAGFLGTSVFSAPTGFVNSFLINSASSFTSSFTTNMGNSILQEDSIQKAFSKGISKGFSSGIVSGLASGLLGGIDATMGNRDFWTGKLPSVDNDPIWGELSLHASKNDHSWIETIGDDDVPNSWGTWGNKNQYPGQEQWDKALRKDYPLELGRSGEAIRVQITKSQHIRLLNYIEKQGNGKWSLFNNCSWFSTRAFTYATGKYISPFLYPIFIPMPYAITRKIK